MGSLGRTTSVAAILVMAFSGLVGPATAGSVCKDGIYTESEGPGTCSWHGGVAVSGVRPNGQTSRPAANIGVANVPTRTRKIPANRFIAIARKLPVRAETPSGYDRDLFTHWTTSNGCTTREWVLIEEAKQGTRVACVVRNGRWFSAFDGVTTRNSSEFDVDHFVPLKEAWDSGARSWNQARRTAFANDLGYQRTLVAASASSNRSKSDRDPAEWLPPRQSYRCTYVQTWVAIKYRWGLTVDPIERDELLASLEKCADTVVRIPQRVPTPPTLS